MEMGLGEEGARGVDTASSHEAAMQGLTVQQTHGIGYTKSLVRLRGGISVSVQTSDGIRKWIKAIVVNNAKTPGILEQVLGPLGKEPQKVRDGPTWTVQHPSGVVLSLVGTVELKLGADVNAKSTTFHVWSCEANVKPHIGIFFSEDTIPKDVVRKARSGRGKGKGAAARALPTAKYSGNASGTTSEHALSGPSVYDGGTGFAELGGTSKQPHHEVASQVASAADHQMRLNSTPAPQAYNNLVANVGPFSSAVLPSSAAAVTFSMADHLNHHDMGAGQICYKCLDPAFVFEN